VYFLNVNKASILEQEEAVQEKAEEIETQM